MMLIALENCEDCKRYKILHPEFKYIQLDNNALIPQERIKLKKSLEKLNWDKKVPVLLDDKMTQLIPRTKLVQELRIRNNKITPCRNCGS
jgi:hypothetical protein